MRFYDGWIYSFDTAVSPQTDGFYCEFLDIKSSPKKGYIHYGYDRYFKVGSSSKMILHFKNDKGAWSEKMIKIPFEKNGDRLEFDYPLYLKSMGMKYKLYKRANIYNACNSDYHMIFSKNADIQDVQLIKSSDYNVYRISIFYKKPLLRINGKVVYCICLPKYYPTGEETIDFIKEHLEEKYSLSYAEFAELAGKFGIKVDNCETQIAFTDGTSLYGQNIDWTDESK